MTFSNKMTMNRVQYCVLCSAVEKDLCERECREYAHTGDETNRDTITTLKILRGKLKKISYSRVELEMENECETFPREHTEGDEDKRQLTLTKRQHEILLAMMQLYTEAKIYKDKVGFGTDGDRHHITELKKLRDVIRWDSKEEQTV